MNHERLGSQIRKLEEYQIAIKPLLQKIITEMTESHKSEITKYFGEVVDIMSKEIPDFDDDSLESIVCGTSMALFQEGISTNLSIEELDSTNYCLYFIFSPAEPNDNAPTLDSCDEKWGKLAELPKEDIRIEYIKGIKGFIPSIKDSIIRVQHEHQASAIFFASFIADIMGEAIGHEGKFINDNIVSIFCGISPILFDNGIVTEIKLAGAPFYCFIFAFRNKKAEDDKPTVDYCLEKWARLFIE